MKWWLVVRADVRRRRASLLLLVVLAGLAGGVAMAAIAGARRTTTSWDRLRAADESPDIDLFAQLFEDPAAVNAKDLAALRAIPGARVAGVNIIPLFSGLMGLDRSGDAGMIYATDDESAQLVLRASHLRGRLPDPDRPDEVVVNEAFADDLRLGVGDRVTLHMPTLATLESCVTTANCTIEEARPIDVVITGIARQATDLDPDALNKFLMTAGPRFAELLTDAHPVLVFIGRVYLDGGLDDAPRFLRDVERRFPDRFGSDIHDPTSASVHDALEVEAWALLALAGVAAISGLLSAAQGFVRHLASTAAERDVLTALGMTRRDRAIAATSSGFVVAVGATALAGAIAVTASTLLPVGLARRAEPDPGLDVDSVVLGLGGVSMLVLLTVVFALLSRHAVGRRLDDVPSRRARTTGIGPGTIPLVALLGVRLAFRSSRRGGATAGAIGGVVVALIVGVAAFVLTASNDELQHDERRYGQPWEATLSVPPAVGNTVAADLARHDELSAVAIATAGEIELSAGARDAVVPAVGFELVRGEMALAVLEGRAPATPAEVALGTALLGELGAAIGDVIDAGDGSRLRIVGRVIVPIAQTDAPDRAVLLTAEGFREHAAADVTGEIDEVLVGLRTRPGTDLDRLLDRGLGDPARLFAAKARKPADVANLSGIGRLPLAVGVFTGVIAVIALAHALLVAERRNRRDVAVLRAFGLRPAGGAAIIACAAATVAALGAVIGVPLGIVTGHLIWRAITSATSVVDRAVVPVASVALPAAILVLAAAVAAAAPAYFIWRQRVAPTLRTE